MSNATVAIEMLPWSEWQTIPLKSGEKKDVRHIQPVTREFWYLWREYKQGMKGIGISVFNRTGEPDGWRVEQWVPHGQRPRMPTFGARTVQRRPLYFKGTIYRRQ